MTDDSDKKKPEENNDQPETVAQTENTDFQEDQGDVASQEQEYDEQLSYEENLEDMPIEEYSEDIPTEENVTFEPDQPQQTTEEESQVQETPNPTYMNEQLAAPKTDGLELEVDADMADDENASFEDDTEDFDTLADKYADDSVIEEASDELGSYDDPYLEDVIESDGIDPHAEETIEEQLVATREEVKDKKLVLNPNAVRNLVLLVVFFGAIIGGVMYINPIGLVQDLLKPKDSQTQTPLLSYEETQPVTPTTPSEFEEALTTGTEEVVDDVVESDVIGEIEEAGIDGFVEDIDGDITVSNIEVDESTPASDEISPLEDDVSITPPTAEELETLFPDKPSDSSATSGLDTALSASAFGDPFAEQEESVSNNVEAGTAQLEEITANIPEPAPLGEDNIESLEADVEDITATAKETIDDISEIETDVKEAVELTPEFADAPLIVEAPEVVEPVEPVEAAVETVVAETNEAIEDITDVTEEEVISPASDLVVEKTTIIEEVITEGSEPQVDLSEEVEVSNEPLPIDIPDVPNVEDTIETVEEEAFNDVEVAVEDVATEVVTDEEETLQIVDVAEPVQPDAVVLSETPEVQKLSEEQFDENITKTVLAPRPDTKPEIASKRIPSIDTLADIKTAESEVIAKIEDSKKTSEEIIQDIEADTQEQLEAPVDLTEVKEEPQEGEDLTKPPLRISRGPSQSIEEDFDSNPAQSFETAEKQVLGTLGTARSINREEVKEVLSDVVSEDVQISDNRAVPLNVPVPPKVELVDNNDLEQAAKSLEDETLELQNTPVVDVGTPSVSDVSSTAAVSRRVSRSSASSNSTAADVQVPVAVVPTVDVPKVVAKAPEQPVINNSVAPVPTETQIVDTPTSTLSRRVSRSEFADKSTQELIAESEALSGTPRAVPPYERPSLPERVSSITNSPSLAQANSYVEQGLTESAKQSFYAMLDRNPADKSALTGLTEIILQSDPNVALNELETIRLAYGDSNVVLVQEGLLLSKLGRSQEAIKTLITASRVDPFDPVSLYNLGILYDQSGNTQSAMESYSKALQNASNFDGANGSFPVTRIKQRISELSR